MTSEEPQEPHLESEEWTRLIQRLDSPAILVVISSWMGEQLRRECTAEDIWQDTLAMAWRDRASHRWQGLRAFRGWLLGIARNRIHDTADRMNAQKRGGGRAPTSLSAVHGDATGSISDALPPRTTTPSRIVSDLERARLMEEALAALPKELEILVRLRLFEELPMHEVAARAGIGRTTANERFFRGATLYQRELERRLGSTSRSSRRT